MSNQINVFEKAAMYYYTLYDEFKSKKNDGYELFHANKEDMLHPSKVFANCYYPDGRPVTVKQKYSSYQEYSVESDGYLRGSYLWPKNISYPIEPLSFEHIRTIYKDITDRGLYSSTLVFWLVHLKIFAKFLRFAEKCFFYKNDSELSVLSSILENDKIILYYKNNNKDNTNIYSIDFIFETTKLPKLNSSESDSGKKLLENDEERYNEFVTIKISRNYGKEMINSYTFLLGADPTMNEDSDMYLFDLVKKIITQAVEKTFESIMDSIPVLIYGEQFKYVPWRYLANGDNLYIGKRK